MNRIEMLNFIKNNRFNTKLTSSIVDKFVESEGIPLHKMKKQQIINLYEQMKAQPTETDAYSEKNTIESNHINSEPEVEDEVELEPEEEEEEDEVDYSSSSDTKPTKKKFVKKGGRLRILQKKQNLKSDIKAILDLYKNKVKEYIEEFKYSDDDNYKEDELVDSYNTIRGEVEDEINLLISESKQTPTEQLYVWIEGILNSQRSNVEKYIT